jgi:hypothetical protein
MTTPPKLTEEQLLDSLRDCPHDTVENLRFRWLYAKDFARAIEAARDQRWIEMLSKQEPVIWLYEGIECHVRGKLIAHREQQKRFETRWWKEVGPLYAHPHPDDTALLRQALEALQDAYEELKFLGKAEQLPGMNKIYAAITKISAYQPKE